MIFIIVNVFNLFNLGKYCGEYIFFKCLKFFVFMLINVLFIFFYFVVYYNIFENKIL